jgi:uncharacterized protein YecT (DUF1311 family)
MTRSAAVSAVAMALALAGSASAQPPMSAHLSATFLACYQRAGSNTVQRSVCAEREVGAQDDRLNKAYQQVMHQLAADPAAHARLRDEERRWIQERDYTCKVNGTTVDGACIVMKTASRADELESRIHF